MATTVYLIVAAGVAVMAAKYAFGPVPAPHHGAMLSEAGEAPGPVAGRILGTLYRVMAGAALAMAVIAWFGLGLPDEAAQG